MPWAMPWVMSWVLRSTTSAQPSMRGYTTSEVAELLDLSPRIVRAFAREGLLAAERDGRSYRFVFQDMVLLRAAKALLDARVPARRVWRALRAIRGKLPRGQSLASLRISAEGDQVVVRNQAASWEPDSGQLTFSFETKDLALRVAPVVRQAAAKAHAQANLSSDDWYDLGLELEAVGATEDAKRAYGQAASVDQANADAHVNLGRLFQEEGRPADAEAQYRKALTAMPRHATATYNLGTALEDLGRSTEALDAYESAVQLAPQFADAHYNLAQLYEQSGDRAAALRHLARYRSLTR